MVYYKKLFKINGKEGNFGWNFCIRIKRNGKLNGHFISKVNTFNLNNYIKHIHYKKRQAKKHRDKGFIEINHFFPGSEGHHLTRDLVVYIPKLMHRKTKHRLDKPETMVEINMESMKWLIKNSPNNYTSL